MLTTSHTPTPLARALRDAHRRAQRGFTHGQGESCKVASTTGHKAHKERVMPRTRNTALVSIGSPTLADPMAGELPSLPMVHWPRTQREPTMPRSPVPQDPWRALTLGVAVAASLLAWRYVFTHHMILLYRDAHAHLD